MMWWRMWFSNNRLNNLTTTLHLAMICCVALKVCIRTNKNTFHFSINQTKHFYNYCQKYNNFQRCINSRRKANDIRVCSKSCIRPCRSVTRLSIATNNFLSTPTLASTCLSKKSNGMVVKRIKNLKKTKFSFQ